MSAQEAAALCSRLYRWLARALPEEFVHAHGAEINQLSDEVIRDAARHRGWVGLFPLAVRMLWDLLIRLVVEHGAELRMNIKHGARTLIASPGFSLVSVLSLGFGMSLASTVYIEFKSTVYRPVPSVSNPESLVTTMRAYSYPDYQEFRNRSQQFESLAAYQSPVPFMLQLANASPERMWGHIVSPDYFDVLGVKCAYGRPGDLVVSYRMWENKLGGDPTVIGQPLRLNGRSITVSGIGPREFQGASPMIASADLFISSTADPGLAPELSRARLADAKTAEFKLIGRLQKGVTQQQAELALDALSSQLEQNRGETDREKRRKFVLYEGGNLFPTRKQDMAAMTGFPLALVAFTLWVACANVATMLLARSAVRRREIAIRLAMGASRSRIVRQFLTESSLLSLVALVVSYPLTLWSLRSVEAFKPALPDYFMLDMRMDWTVHLFSFGVALLAGVLFGLAPALQSARSDVAPQLKAGAHTRLGGYRWFSMRNMLVLQQVAGSLTLLLLTGFIVLGFQRSAQLDVGFDATGLYTMSCDPTRSGYDSARSADLVNRIRDRIQRLPGVSTVALTDHLPLSPGGDFKQSMASPTEGLQIQHDLQVTRVGSQYMDVMGIPILAGRAVRDGDLKSAAAIVVVNETAARDFGTGFEALGKILRIDEKPHEIVGIAKGVGSGAMIKEENREVYVPLIADDYAKLSNGVSFLIRSAPGIDVLVEVRRAVRDLDPNLAVFDLASMSDHIRRILYIVKATMVLYAAIGLFGMVLAVIGLAGVTAYAVAQRRKEIGIRMALGAQRSNVLRLVMREGAWMVIAGALVGQLLAMGVGRVLTSYLSIASEAMKTSFSDPILILGAPVLLGGLAMIACYLPARAATRLNPIVTLREE